MNATSRQRWIVLLCCVVALGATAGGVRLATAPAGSHLEFVIRDAVSHSWVWDAKAVLQDRVIRSYYQSDNGPRPQLFTHLERGEHELVVSAPSYVTRRIPVTITRGAAILDGPVDMVGYEIPGLADFLVFERATPEGYIAELRPVRTNGRAATNHPCLDLWVGCAVSVQTVDSVLTTQPVQSGSERGKTLFRAEIEWEWDDSPHALFRYHARIPTADIEGTQAPYLVFDYLIVVRDPRQVTSLELDELMERVWGTTDVRQAIGLLEEYRDVLRFFVDTSWNVERDE